MSLEEHEETSPLGLSAEAEISAVLGMFDAPAFMRRGHELDDALNRLDVKLGRVRDEMLDMVRLRLRQWAATATGPDDFRPPFASPVAPLLALVNAVPQAWSDRPAPVRRRLIVGRDLAASVARFNRLWTEKLGNLKLDTLNKQIDHYNRYYVLEKECVLGSARLAARYFTPRPFMTPETLLDRFPLLPEPNFETRVGSHASRGNDS